MSETNAAVKGKKRSAMSKYGVWAGVLLVVFLLGLVPMWLQKRTADQSLEDAQKQLQMARIKDHLMTAIVEARGGEYETARQNASEFFTKLSAEIEKGDAGALPADMRENLKAVFNDRDNIITLLAQRDPASVDRLADLYGIHKQATASK
mgnify:CR=1 FL=1|jgi:hypothetical protein